MTNWILITAGAAALSFILSGIIFTARTRKKVSYMLDALEDKETNFRFREDKIADRRFNRTLNRLRRIFEKEQEEIKEQEKYFGKMLDKVQTGIAVIDSDGESIQYCNATALSMLGVSSLSTIRQLRRISPSMADAFSKISEGHEEKATCTNETSTVTFSVTSSSADLRGKSVKIVVFNDISSDIEENEAASWTKLIRVLTHEIMNTVTPIASLSEALAGYAATGTANSKAKDKAKDSDEESFSGPDIKAGLETIASSAKGLIKFVNSYRDLTHLPMPDKKAFYLRELIERVLKLTEEQISAAGAVCTYTEKSDDILLYADMGQISQIFINMLKNAIQAGATRIEITAEIDKAESVVVNISNNGAPISRESQEEIFVPFYTTKQTGTGIGLSISRQIMRMHNGTIRLTRSDDAVTTFTLIFK